MHLLKILTVTLFCVSLISAETVALSGTVTKTGSLAGIAGVKVSLAKLPSFTTTTNVDGSFHLGDALSVRLNTRVAAIPQFLLRENSLIVMSGTFDDLTRIELFSSEGKKITSYRISDCTTKDCIQLPKISSGISIMRLTAKGRTYIYTIVASGNTRFLKNGTISVNAIDATPIAKLTVAAPIDTLIAEKKGYLPKRVTIDSYKKTGLTITLDSAAGNPEGRYPIPAGAGAESIANPDHVIGTGTPASCTPELFINAVAKGGKIVFNGGTVPFTITLPRTAKVFNDANPDIVIDGGGIVTLSGGDTTRILYMNTCDEAQHWTTPNCDNQDHPRLTVQNITFAHGNAKNGDEEPGGGAIFAQGGRLKIVNCRFFNNVCAETGPDVGGGAVRAFMQYNGNPIYVVNSTFGGAEGFGNSGSNGGALSSIGVSWTIINCLFSNNRAIGNGGNPQQTGTPGGGSGGAIYNDGNTMTLSIFGTLIEQNSVKAYGAAVFFVTNDHTGNIRIDETTIRDNSGGSWYPKNPGISMHEDTRCEITNSTIR